MSTETVYATDNEHDSQFCDDFAAVCDAAAEGEDGNRFVIYQGEVLDGETGVSNIKPITVQYVFSGPDCEGWDILSDAL